eukprot:m.248031 g.248031  ORF g.248031 m.248031 type:complete len:321 (-) comp15406_c0_seq2:94-1056(-)
MLWNCNISTTTVHFPVYHSWRALLRRENAGKVPVRQWMPQVHQPLLVSAIYAIDRTHAPRKQRWLLTRQRKFTVQHSSQQQVPRQQLKLRLIFWKVFTIRDVDGRIFIALGVEIRVGVVFLCQSIIQLCRFCPHFLDPTHHCSPHSLAYVAPIHQPPSPELPDSDVAVVITSHDALSSEEPVDPKTLKLVGDMLTGESDCDSSARTQSSQHDSDLVHGQASDSASRSSFSSARQPYVAISNMSSSPSSSGSHFGSMRSSQSVSSVNSADITCVGDAEEALASPVLPSSLHQYQAPQQRPQPQIGTPTSARQSEGASTLIV